MAPSVKEPLIRLLNITDNDAVDGLVPDAASQDITLLKKALLTVITARITCELNAHIDVVALAKELTANLQANTPEEKIAIYGYDLSFQVEQIKREEPLLIVRVSFGIPCGDDNILLVYRFRKNQWHLDLQWQSKPYHEISGAFGSGYEYLLLNNQEPIIAITHGSPWCTSAWGQLTMDVIKLGKEGQPQSLLFSQTISYYSGEEPARFKLKPDGFELRASVHSLDTDILTRTGIYRYQVKGDKVNRIQPIALHGRDFVDEWLALNKETASELTESKNREALMSIHTKFYDRYGYFGAVRKCYGKQEQGLFQVEMNFYGVEKDSGVELHYFLIQPIANGFIMKDSSSTASPNCTGSDIMSQPSF